MNKHYKKIGIPKTGVHLLRHTFGKIMVMNKCDAITLMHWFGHSKTEETKRYVNLFANDLAITVETFNPTAKQNFINDKISTLLHGLNKESGEMLLGD